jgi:hypothetical protein
MPNADSQESIMRERNYPDVRIGLKQRTKDLVLSSLFITAVTSFSGAF